MTVMAALEGAKQAAGLTRSFAEPDSFASALLGGEFEIMPVRGEPFTATLRVLRVGDTVVQQPTTSAHIARGGIAPGMAVLMLNLQATERPARVNGADIGGAEAVLLGGGAEVTSYNPRLLDWAAIGLPLSLLDELADLAPPQLRVRGETSVLALKPDLAARLVGALSAAGRLVDDLPMLLGSPDCASNLAMALREEVGAALTTEAEVRPRPRAVGQALRVVAAAEAFMEAQLARPVYTETLCAALRVSPRLGHFASDYRALFGELPSETLAARGVKGSAHGRARQAGNAAA
jgi:hypothetical protein